MTGACLQCELSSSGSLLLWGNSDSDQLPVIREHAYPARFGEGRQVGLETQTLARSAAWDLQTVEK